MSRTGRPHADRCTRGHELSQTRRRRAGTGKTYCSECQKARNRETIRVSRAVMAGVKFLLQEGLALKEWGQVEAWQRRVSTFLRKVKR